MLNGRSGLTFDQAILIIEGMTEEEFSLQQLRALIREQRLDTYHFGAKEVLSAKSLRAYLKKETGKDYHGWLAEQVKRTMVRIDPDG